MDEEEKVTEDEVVEPQPEPAEPTAEIPENPKSPETPDIDAIVERAVANAVERIGQQIAAAEERGYQRAVKEVNERQAVARENAPTRCNFLNSTRPDVWEN